MGNRMATVLTGAAVVALPLFIILPDLMMNLGLIAMVGCMIVGFIQHVWEKWG